MLYRKIEEQIKKHLIENKDKILLVEGARQVGKTYIIRHVGKSIFKNFIEINMVEDSEGERLFSSIKTINDFYLMLSIKNGDKFGNKEDTLVFIDEIQAYPYLLTFLKFLREDNRFTFIASGSLLGVSLRWTTSIPMGSITLLRMYPLDFEEFLYANGVGKEFVSFLREKAEREECLDEVLHNRLINFFKTYLISGGLPDAVCAFVERKNILETRKIQEEIHSFYSVDASKYDFEKKLNIMSVYSLIPSNMEKVKKRVCIKEIEDKKGKTFKNYQEEFEYLISAGIALSVQAISNPSFPLLESSTKNLLKLYLNDVGLLSQILYKTNVNAILQNEKSINLGSLYETVVATELASHGHKLYYYDNKKKGEVDFIIDDFDSLSVLPIEVKSGRDYSVHSALNNFVKEDYPIKKAIVLSNNREVERKEKIVYLPIYYVMFL